MQLKQFDVSSTKKIINKETYTYFQYPVHFNKALSELHQLPESYHEILANQNLFKLTNYCINNVKAYKSFLSEKNFNLSKITSLDEFKLLPPIPKSYVSENQINDLVPASRLNEIITFSSTSGTTGSPVFFPREEIHDIQNMFATEIYLTSQFQVHKKKTLAILGFGLGIWIGGMITFKALYNIASSNKYPLTVVPTGLNLQTIVTTISRLQDQYDQIILIGYPPHIKDMIAEINTAGLNFNNLNIKVLTAAENYSEEYRSFLQTNLNIKNKYDSFVNIYGSVEFGTMGFETPLSILIREICHKNPTIRQALFPNTKILPSLVQYNPKLIHFEEINGELLLSGYGSSFPLIRYKIGDIGGIIKFNEMILLLKKFNIDIIELLREKVDFKSVLQLPFVYVGDPTNKVLSYYGINIYPVYIRNLLNLAMKKHNITGRFKLAKTQDDRFNEYLNIFIELSKNGSITDTEVNLLSNSIFQTLKEKSSEYLELYKSKGKSVIPNIKVIKYRESPFEDFMHKEKWVLK
ncbi:hypothetical protein DID75_00785 [Candidatus Marinamargulisbacteria bacterium SCGC AG-410-N11]|nr:hypothetical protein DID75_00785 [Candidatus Marinamargulisbacteria bacterium SCGC AG-410-N11]